MGIEHVVESRELKEFGCVAWPPRLAGQVSSQTLSLDRAGEIEIVLRRRWKVGSSTPSLAALKRHTCSKEHHLHLDILVSRELRFLLQLRWTILPVTISCVMSLIPFFGGRGSSFWDPFSLTGAWDPFDFGTTGAGDAGQDQGAITPQLSMAKDVSAVLNTRMDWLETPEAHIIKADLPGNAEVHFTCDSTDVYRTER